jgi:hypothetical protein
MARGTSLDHSLSEVLGHGSYENIISRDVMENMVIFAGA